MENGHDVSSLYNVEDVPSNYVFPQDYRPGKIPIPVCDSIPVIDLGNAITNPQDTIHQIMEAAKEFGVFQMINHGVSEKIISDVTNVYKEFFSMPAEEKANSNIDGTSNWLYTSSTGYNLNGVHLWRDNIKHPCHPLEECMQKWPQKPTNYREVVSTYLTEIGKLSLRILDLISKGLGLQVGYFDEISQVQLLSSSTYQRCPDPSLTLGLLRHQDPSLITILYQGDISGLQALKDGNWIGVGAQPNAFVVNIGNQLEIISNGKLRSVEHRVVTNSRKDRSTIAVFINPPLSCIIEPAKVLVNEFNPPRYNARMYKDFIYSSKAFGPNNKDKICKEYIESA